MTEKNWERTSCNENYYPGGEEEEDTIVHPCHERAMIMFVLCTKHVDVGIVD